jgi:hypothetical protein
MHYPEVLTSDEKGKCNQLGYQKGWLVHVIHHEHCLQAVHAAVALFPQTSSVLPL